MSNREKRSAGAPLIGVNVYFQDADKDSWRLGQSYLREEYYRVVRLAGGIPLLIPPCQDIDEIRLIIEGLDGFLLVGGEDIPPERYGRPRHPATCDLPRAREISDFLLAETLLREYPEKPILAICGGMQLINVVQGGTLFQHIPDCIEKPLFHRAPGSEAVVPDAQSGAAQETRWVSHPVDIQPGSGLEAILGTRNTQVNSFHHQCIDILGEGLRITAFSSDGVAEALEGDSGRAFLLGLQWHPEYLMAPEAELALFRALIDNCRKGPGGND